MEAPEREPRPFWRALESAVQAAAALSARPLANVIGNHNGEEARAYAWGTVHRLGERHDAACGCPARRVQGV